jgi:hypothetical protein
VKSRLHAEIFPALEVACRLGGAALMKKQNYCRSHITRQPHSAPALVSDFVNFQNSGAISRGAKVSPDFNLNRSGYEIHPKSDVVFVYCFMARGNEVPIPICNQIIGIREAKMSFVAVGKKLSLSEDMVCKIYKRWTTRGL